MQVALSPQFLEGAIQGLCGDIEVELFSQYLALKSQCQHQPAQTQAKRFHAAWAQTAEGCWHGKDGSLKSRVQDNVFAGDCWYADVCSLYKKSVGASLLANSPVQPREPGYLNRCFREQARSHGNFDHAELRALAREVEPDSDQKSPRKVRT
ncbi:Threonine dehydratase [Pseudomonas syringae pv. actinidiae]|uniref:Threonine dehydratase n=1 Tax=Pseudomonas syringae pv. actinidiae TaxID=103796 RepID=A0A2V0QDT6_PSESF|nr:Threonine dehydratase [Pseudomonas syringae pv. actinidiae]